MATPEELDDEDRRVRQLRTAVQLTFSVIAQTDVPLADAEAMVVSVRHTAGRLFPGKESVFDLIYLPRFRRLLADRYPAVRLGAPRVCEAS